MKTKRFYSFYKQITPRKNLVAEWRAQSITSNGRKRNTLMFLNEMTIQILIKKKLNKYKKFSKMNHNLRLKALFHT